MTDDNGVKTDVEILKRDFGQLSGLFARLDVTIDKLSDVANGINRMLAVHETRLAQQEETTRVVFRTMEGYRVEDKNEHQKMETRLSKVDDELKDKLDQFNVDLTAKMKHLCDAVARLERWKYLVLGGAITLGFILAKLPMILTLLGN